MDKLILEDEISQIVGTYSKFSRRYMHPPKFAGISKKSRFLYDKVMIITDENPIGRMLFPVFETIQNKGNVTVMGGCSVNCEFPTYEDFDYGDFVFSYFQHMKILIMVILYFQLHKT